MPSSVGQRQHDGVARLITAAEQIGQPHAGAQREIELQRSEGVQTETQQDPRQHRGGNRLRNVVHQAGEQPGDAAQQDQTGSEDKHADRLVDRCAGQAGDQQRRTGRRPGGEDRGTVVKRESERGDAHRDPQRAQPAADLCRRGARGGGGLENDRGRAGVTHQDGDKAGHDGGQGQMVQGEGWAHERLQSVIVRYNAH